MNRRDFLATVAATSLAAAVEGRAAGSASVNTTSIHQFESPLGPVWSGLQAGIMIERDLVYKTVNGESLRLDVYRPEAPHEPRPLVAWVCGGGWKSMNKFGALKHVAWLCAHGFVVMAMNYRLSPAVRYPAHLEDCVDALDWVRREADRFRINPNRLGVMGDSAGGHLALLMGSGSADRICGRAEAPAVAAVCALCPPTDLTRADAIPGELWDPFLGGGPAEQPELAALASPVRQLNPASMCRDYLLLHGDADTIVPVEQSELFTRQARELGARVELRRFVGVGHTNDFYRDGPTRDAILDFFRRHLQPPSAV